jgi:hypothetical protein
VISGTVADNASSLSADSRSKAAAAIPVISSACVVAHRRALIPYNDQCTEVDNLRESRNRNVQQRNGSYSAIFLGHALTAPPVGFSRCVAD